MRIRGSMNRWPLRISRCQTAQCSSFPRRVVAPGFSLSFRVHPPTRGGRSADRRTYSVVAFARRDRSARVRRGASHDAGRSPLGAPPWRFSAGGRASISGILRSQRASQPAAWLSRPSTERRSANETRAGTQRDNSRSAIWFTGCDRSPLGPGSRCARPGRARTTRAKSRRAKRTVGRRPNSRCQTAQCSSFPRRVVAPGFVSFLSHPSPKRGGRSADRRTMFCCRVCETRLIRASEARRVP